ncbi:PREDICTED: transmembrane channel-like protein 4 [Nanorana parkeri]|uniref:transmembrane channel-like protein 4 n=1 Tax=Nanorana parkeri TaxID=125878 RepID=UPI0008545D62|nr:PREDICTED: transmembrane channel-like protein 4 [Nanorana parkeri]
MEDEVVVDRNCGGFSCTSYAPPYLRISKFNPVPAHIFKCTSMLFCGSKYLLYSPEPAHPYCDNKSQVLTVGAEFMPTGLLRNNWTDEPMKDEDMPVKELHCHLQKKREIRTKQQKINAKKLGFESWKEKQRKSLRQFCSRMSGFLQYLTLWRRTLETIGGHFGTGIQSYFSFLRFLVLMNVVTFLLIGGFIVIPSILFSELNLGHKFLTSNSSDVCFEYSSYPQGLERFYIFIMDILMGTGFMEFTYMFYGYYKNTSVNLLDFSYNIPLAYLVTTMAYFLLSLVWTVVRSVQGFKQSLVAEDSSMSSYTDKVFSGWDFCIKDKKVIKLKQKSILYELKVDLEEAKMRCQQAQHTMAQRARIYTPRIFLNILVVALIGGAFYCIYRSTSESQKLLEHDKVKGNFILELLVGYLPSIVITAANFILPMFFNITIKWEKYTFSTEVRFTLIRCVFLRLASLGMLLYSLWDNITCSGNKESEKCKCGYNYEDNHCWETRVGREMYKLLIFDFLTVLVMIMLVDFPRKMMVDHCSCKPIQLWGQQEFLVPQFVLDIIYGQTVCWIGTFFCPLLPLLNTVKYFIIFYVKKLTLFNNCQPASRTFRASSANFFFLLVLLLGLAMSWVPILYSIFSITPSKACGPFRNQQYIWETIPTAVDSLAEVAKNFFWFVGSQAFVVPLFFFSCILMFYLMALGSSYGKVVRMLKDQLQMERNRKIFLNQVYHQIDQEENGGRLRTDLPQFSVNRATWPGMDGRPGSRGQRQGQRSEVRRRVHPHLNHTSDQTSLQMPDHLCVNTHRWLFKILVGYRSSAPGVVHEH